MRNPFVFGTIVVLGLALAAVLFALAFGTPQAPEAGSGVAVADEPAADTPSGGTADTPGSAQAPQGSSAEGTVVPQPDPSSPLAVEIPGCVCHSDDPKLVKEHAGYRMNQCFGCHAGGMPEMGQ